MADIANSDLMTEGNIKKKIIVFAIPLFIGQLFQQLYNTVDSVIVGNFVGSEALAAVTSTGNLTFMLVGFFCGISAGSSVIIARYIGAQKDDDVSKSVHTATAIGLISSILLTVVGVLATPTLLRLMDTPDSVITDSISYLRIYFAGSLGMVMYNTFVGILQSAGDSKHPLYYLIFSSILNVVLDLLFIAGFGMGVSGAATATIISQLVSALLAMGRLMRVNESYRLQWSRLRLHPNMVKQILNIGIPSGLQNSIISFSNVVIQSYINSYGKDAMAGIGAYCKIEGFAFLPVTCFGMALTTFISQNLGAKKQDRARSGIRFGLVTGMILSEIIGMGMYMFAPQLVALFDSHPEVIIYGVARARIVSPMFFMCAYTHIMSAVLRGCGKATVPTAIFLTCWCVIRILIIEIVGRFIQTIDITYWVYVITWTLSSIALFIYWRRHRDTIC